MALRNEPKESRLLTLHEAARYCGESYWTFRARVLAGVVPAVRLPSPRARSGVGRRIHVDRADLDRLIDRNKERLS